MSNIQLVPLFGTSFTVFVPMLMILFALFASLNLLPRMLSWVGVETEDPVGGPMCPCFNWFAPPPPLSGDDLQKYESGRLVVVNELKQASLLKMIATGGNATRSAGGGVGGGGINLARGSLSSSTSTVSRSQAQSSSEQHTPVYARNDISSYSRGGLSASSNSYLLDDDDDFGEPRRVDDDFNDYERGSISMQSGGHLRSQSVLGNSKYTAGGSRISGQEKLLDHETSRSFDESPSGAFFGFKFSSYFKVNNSEDSAQEDLTAPRTSSSSTQSLYSAVPPAPVSASAANFNRPNTQNNSFGFSGGGSGSGGRNNAFALPSGDDEEEDFGGRYG